MNVAPEKRIMSEFHLPLFKSKFLHACANYLYREHGINDIVPFAKLRQESFCASWDSGLSGDFPSFFTEDGGWLFDRRNDDGGALMMDVFDRGAVIFRSLDGESHYLKTRIEAPEELGEMMALFMSIKPSHLESANWVTLPLSSIIEQVFLVLPRDGRDTLVPYDPKQLALQQPQLWRAISVLHSIDTKEDITNLQYSCWADWVARHADWSTIPEPIPFADRDMFFSGDWGLHSRWLHAERETEFFDMGPRFALRINAKHSPMFFHLFTQQTREGSAIFNEFSANLANPQSWLKRTQVNYPSSIISQRRLAFEFRVLRQEYDDTHDSLVREREPVKQLIELYGKRVQLIGLLHSEYVHEIEAAQCPLPFFIEYPLRRFSRADEPFDKVLKAMQVLSVLTKSLVLLPLEEALAQNQCSQSIRALADDLSQKKPLSDGGWNELRALLRSLCEESSLSLPLFGQLLSCSAEIDQPLNQLVKARNDYHHRAKSVADVKTVLSEFEAKLASIAPFLRRHFASIRFLIPLTSRVVDGGKLVRALQLSGFETEFESKELKVTASLESFPSDKIVATDAAGARVVVLGRFFTSKSLKAETIDLGIFDRVEGDQAHFEFVRGLGNTP